ncbi:alanine:cation symporter family protein [Rickettsiales bacterium]|nr:alanine:cation symporter family protein [Rickettsiales bacterium]
MELDQKIENLVQPISDFFTDIIFVSISFQNNSLPLVVIWLVFASLFFTFYFRFINIRAFKRAFLVAIGRYDKPNSPGEITHFQAFTAAMSGTIGLGNIAGVAVAISIGGPGAMLWMIIMAFFGMTLKFVEVSLGHKYRKIYSDGTVSGGAIRYLSSGLKDHGFPKLGKILAFIFAICCIGGSFGGGNMFQANQAFEQIVIASGGENSPFNEKGWLGGIIFAIIVGSIIIGGIKSIGKVTEKLVPIMGGFYCLACIYIIFTNYSLIPGTFHVIFINAFSTEATFGGVVGVMIAGIKRAVFSNESGIGSAPIAYAPAKSDSHLNTGFMSLLAPFVDTIIICSMTALVIIITGSYLDSNNIEGVELTSRAFESVFSWFPLLLAFAITLFAISTLITWSYYGLRCWTYLFGQNKLSVYSFKIIFLMFTVIGTSMNLNSVINFSDAMIFAMSIPNIIGLYFLAPSLIKDLKNYNF